ncbi:MAG: NTP transferase domain-containing protein [Bacteroidota bacterium]|nr:NTP transferase domain-containing protein [Candidatus Kapabacteria bacterium]MDW8074758.1 NTP transferase domain-containing protein [Bacteroidota bacterium]
MSRIVGVILAAGKGKRMHNPEVPKVLVQLKGKPLLQWVIEALLPLNLDQIITVVGYRRELVIDFLTEHFPQVFIAIQEEQKGTGHAVLQIAPYVSAGTTLLIVNGDVPLVQPDTLDAFLQSHATSGATLSVLSTIVPSPNGYGRIIRSHDGSLTAIVEEADLQPAQRSITEVNTGIYAAESETLLEALRSVRNTNAQQEYYLTDAVAQLVGQGKLVHVWCCPEWHQFAGVNTPEQLTALAALVTMQDRSQQ